MNTLHLDFETRSEAVLKGPTGVGAAKYAMHPTTRVLCMAISINNGPTSIFKWPTFNPALYPNGIPPFPAELAPFVNNPEYVWVAHNAFFEECVWEYVLHQRYGWPSLMSPKRWACTMAKAAMCGLPLGLDKCGIALQITSRKDAVLGKSILNKMSVPCKWDDTGKVIWNEDPALFDDLYRYCIGDVDAEKEIYLRLPELPPFERRVWEQDFIVNHRGIHTDVKTAKQAMNLAAIITDKLNRRLDILTLGQVSKATQLDEMKLWLEGQGEKLESLDKAALRTLLARKDLPELIREVIYIRSQVGKSSTSKYKAVVCTTADDGRVRGALQYHGAGTGRWVGRRVQFQNLPMGSEKNPDAAIAAIQDEDPDWFEMCYTKPMETLSSTIRGISLTAPEGKKLLCADYAGIEVAVLMWVAGQEDALDLLRSKQTLYIPMANYIYKRTDISKHGTPVEYKVGKETILGAGFGMWWPKFLEQCEKKGISLGPNDEATETFDEYVPDIAAIKVAMAQGKPAAAVPLKKKTRRMTLAEVRAKEAVLAYRTKYTKVLELWAEMELAAKNAIRFPQNSYPVAGGKVVWGMDMKREFLCCLLPSGRCLRYYHPFIKNIKTPWGKEREEIHFWGEGGESKHWGVQKTYGGSLVENVIQALARDIMAHGMMNCEAAGFPIVLTVHDELIAEVKAPTMEGATLGAFIARMCDIPNWAAGMPIRAEGWVGLRYKK